MEVSSQVVSQLPVLRNALLIGRGGAALAAATAVVAESATVSLSGGAKAAPIQEKVLGIDVSPEGKSVLYMAVAMACHYLGYSIARPITVALFTSESTGYAGFPAAFPFAMAFVSPVSLLMLMGYGGVLDKSGPRGALIWSTLFCAVVVSLSALGIALFDQTGFTIGSIPAVKFIPGPLFVFRESYVQLLTSQYWSFMASALTPNQSARWFGPIAGLTSIASAVAGFAVSPLVDRVGLSGALLGTGLFLLLSLIGASKAYAIADQYDFTPKDTKNEKQVKGRQKVSAEYHEAGMVEKATKLFKRVPVLSALFQEILASQGLATLLNVCFVARLGTAIPDDGERAGWVGVFFALINLIAMVMQFGVLPPLMTIIEPRDLWRAVPVVSLFVTGFQAFQKDPSLFIVSASLLVMKVTEYSARRMLDEMVFVPLDFESRYVGKEIIGVFGYRFGKSLMSLALSGLTSIMGNFGLQQLSILSSAVCFVWMGTAWKLSNLVPTRQEAEDVYEKSHKKKERKTR